MRPRADQGLVARAASRCSAMPRIRCCNTSRRARRWRPRTRSAWPRRSPSSPTTCRRRFDAYVQQRYLRTARVQIMARVYGDFYHARGPAAELRNQMLGGAHAGAVLRRDRLALWRHVSCRRPVKGLSVTSIRAAVSTDIRRTEVREFASAGDSRGRRTAARRAVRRLRQRLAVLPEISEIEGTADPRARDRRHGRAARQRRGAALRRQGRRPRRARRVSALRALRLLPRRRLPPVRRDRHAQQARHRALRLDADQPGAVAVGRLQPDTSTCIRIRCSTACRTTCRRRWRRWRCRSATASNGPTCRARSASAKPS